MTQAAPHHRAWLHALEADLSVPDSALQCARVYADFAAGSTPGEPFVVTWQMMRRCTHQRTEKLAKSVKWLRDAGWLFELPHKNGARKYHVLSTPQPLPGVEVEPLPEVEVLPTSEVLPGVEVEPLPGVEVEPLPTSEVRTSKRQNVRDGAPLRWPRLKTRAASGRPGG